MVAAEGILDAERALVEAAEAEGAEVHVPFAIVDGDEAALGCRTPDGSLKARSYLGVSPLHRSTSPMYRTRQQDLPFQGSSHHFIGADNGDVNVSAFLASVLSGRGPGPHRHPYDEIQFLREGRGLYTVNGTDFEAGAGDILVIKAGEIHSFRCVGEAPLVQVDVHLSPRFIQENLTWGSVERRSPS